MREKHDMRDPAAVRVTFDNRQRTVAFPAESRALVTAVVDACVRSCGFARPASVHVTLVGNRAIRALNRLHRGKDAVTDVLSFPSLHWHDGKPVLSVGDIDPETGRCFLGDLVVCMPRMRRQAVEYGHVETRELAFLAAHGTLHLLGFDHELQEEEADMFARQEAVLASLGLPRMRTET